MPHHNSETASEPFAIIGISLKLPQEATDEPSLWGVLESGKNLMTPWPESRISIDSFDDGGEPGKPNTIKGPGAHFVREDPAAFDAPFFATTTKEATAMNPQQRWALEGAYHAFENAGIPAEKLRGSRTAVFATYMMDDYLAVSTRDPDQLPRQSATGLAAMMIANRVSWFFGMQGPSVLVETGCSSAMVALDMACNSMRSGDADMALVIGSTILLCPDSTIMLSSMNFLSPDSKSFSFDARANGYARGEGVVALVLKPLRGALADGDVIRAVVRATGQNQDGRTPILTQPSADAQEALIRHVYAKAGLGLEDTRYFEAHGTGTSTGDLIEMTGIGKTFREHRTPGKPLYVGSIKPNVGHLEGASASASIVKAIMILEKGIIPPNALFEKMNPGIDAEYYNVPKQSLAWPAPGLRRVSVNSFGVGGANAHAILDDAYHYLQSHGLAGFHNCGEISPLPNGHLTDAANCRNDTDSTAILNHEPKLLVWSAADASAAQRMLDAYQAYFLSRVVGQTSKLGQLAHTLAMRRSLMTWRSFAVAGADTEQLTAAKPVRASAGGGIAFVFTGQGAQHPGMGLELLRYRAFKASLNESDKTFTSLGCEWSIFDELLNADNIDRPEFSQPLCTALQISLVDLLRSFGIAPAVVIGHSSGEVAAAYAIGALSHSSACRVAYWRGQLTGKLRLTNNGAMLSANIPESQVESYLEKAGIPQDTVHTACINSPTNVTLSGPSKTLDSLKQRLDEQQIFAHKVNTGVAYHSPAMRAIAGEYFEQIQSLQAGEPSEVPMVSSVSGDVVVPGVLSTPQYWMDNMISPVRFSDAVQRLADIRPDKSLPPGINTVTDVVEIGPHPALRRPTKDNIASIPAGSSIRYHWTLERSKSALHRVISLAGGLFCHGHPVSVSTVNTQAEAAPRVPALVDCPSYPFDHSRKYWTESRLSRDFRLRSHSQGHLLGKRTHDWNPLSPRWRNWLSLETMPWMADHSIDGSIVCPGTGMIVMVLEAVKQLLTGGDHAISGFLLKQAQFLAPIMVGESVEDATETNLHLRPITGANEKQASSFEARIFSYRENRWTENFRAEIQAQFEETDGVEIDAGQEAQLDRQRTREYVEQAFKNCAQAFDAEEFYAFLAKYGSKYGPAFRHLVEMRWDGNATAVARVEFPAAKKHYDPVDSPVHPSVLDAAVHLVNSYVSSGLTEPIPALVPQRFASLWVSAKAWDRETASLRIVSEMLNSRGATTVDKNLFALSDDGAPLAIFENLSFVKAWQAHDMQEDESESSLLFGITWKPQMSGLQGQELRILCEKFAKPRDEAASVQFIAKLEHAMRLAARKALAAVTEEELEQGPKFLRKYAASLRHQFEVVTCPEASLLSDSDIEALLKECEAERPEWRLLPAIARSLGPILRAEMDPMELFFSADMAAADYYSEIGRVFMEDGRLEHFLDLASHEEPGLKVLEVGAGTGGMTQHMLVALQALEAQTGQRRFSEYTFTDISSAFFEKPQTELSDYQDRMTFKTLNIENNPVSQGFDIASYDVVVAASVLHATSDLTKSLRHLRSLLKPNGYLVLVEPISHESTCINIGFGCFEGWWTASEDWRQQSPLVTEKRWDELLCETGFSGAQLTVPDYHREACHYSSLMVASAVALERNGCNGCNGDTTISHRQDELLILYDPVSEAQTSLATDIASEYPAAEMVGLTRFLEINWAFPSNGVVISLLEVEQPRLAALQENDFSLVKKLVQEVPQILWVTSTSFSSDPNPDPHYSVATGLLRVVRAENPNKRAVTLHMGTTVPSSRIRFVGKILQSCFLEEAKSAEAEFMVQDGNLHIARAIRQSSLDDFRLSLTRPQLKAEPWQPGPALALEFGIPGMLDTLRFREDVTQENNLRADEVEIKAEAWPISPRDLSTALGRLGRDGKLGFECAGTVTRVGPSCSSVQPGDRVMMGSFGTMCSHPRAEAGAVLKIPEALSMQQAVAVISPGMTAYHALVNVARLQHGETVLIHSAADATGQFAIGIAKMLGAKVLATVDENEKKQLLMDHFDIPGDHIFYIQNTSFVQGVKRLKNGDGVDVVLNSLSEGLQASWECIPPYGRFVDIGHGDISVPVGNFAKNASFSAVDIVHIQETKKALARSLMEKVLHLAAGANFIGIPEPLNVYPVSKSEEAFRYMQSGKSSGRVIITAEDGDMVPKFAIHRSTWKFDSNASYVIAGGLGGLGRPIIRWMAGRGAKCLILLSRSGATSQAAIDVISELREKGVHVLTPRCDVSSAKELSATLTSLEVNTPSLPSIKGCINATMALQDSIFENMTHAQWSTTVRSKVDASWNLHQLLPTDLDFFILLSSIVGVYGSPGQANYAAGCTFQDALARYRTAAGKPASVSLDLGWMRDDGVVRESADYARRLASTANFNPVATTDMLAMLGHYCDPALAPLTPDQSQLLVGASTPAEARSRGGDAFWASRTRMFAGFDVALEATGTHGPRSQPPKGEEFDAAQLFIQADGPIERISIVVAALKAKLARALGVEAKEVDGGKGLADYGVDSLMAVELRNWIQRDFEASLAVFEIMQDGKNIDDIGILVEDKNENGRT